MNDLKQKTFSGFIYKFAERGATQLTSFVVQILLARLLMPEEFGTVALLTVLFTILDVFVTYGFGNSLVVNKNSDDLDFSTCFYFGITLAMVIYLIVFWSSPYISYFFYKDYELDVLVKVMALRLPIAAVNSVQHAYVAKKMRFKMFFYSTFIGTFLSGVVGVSMAIMGFGVWALVGQYLSNSLFSTTALWFFAKWRPKWMFSFKRLKVIFDYGWKILATGLIDTMFGQLRSLLIAKVYTRKDLAFYDRGDSFAMSAMKSVEPTISGVLFPALSNCNDNPQMMKDITRRVIKSSSFILCPILIGLAVVAKPLVIVLLTEKWLDSVIFLQIGCMAYLLRPLQVINNSIIRASGRSGLLLKLDILKKSIGVILLLVCIPIGVVAIAISYVLLNVISTIINVYPNRKILKYGYREQFMDFSGSIMISVIMGVMVWSVSIFSLSYLCIIIIQIVVGFVVYLSISEIIKFEPYVYLKTTIKRIIKNEEL